jgi:DNA-binding MarR family transcriptional regulator
MSRLLAGMERKGLILRRADPADARRKIITSTAAAEGMKERCRDVVQEVLEQPCKT